MKRVSIRRKERELSDMAKITFGAVQRAIRKAFEGSGISELPTPTPTPSSDPSTTTPEVLTFQHPPELELERRVERLKGVKASSNDSANHDADKGS